MNAQMLIDNGVDVNHALDLLGDMEMFNETVGDFLEESKTRIPNIIKSFNESDMENYAILVHAMKSDSKYLGFTKLAEMSYEHEMASKSNNIEYVKENINPLIIEANRIINLCKTYLGE